MDVSEPLAGIPTLSSQEAAAWVQAIGSVVAIFAGFAFVHFQNVQARRARLRALVALTGALIRQLHAHMEMLRDTPDKSFLKIVCQRALQEYAGLRQVLLQIDLSAINKEGVWFCYAGQVAALDYLLSELQQGEAILDASELSEAEQAEHFIASIGESVSYSSTMCGQTLIAIRNHHGVRSPTRREYERYVSEVEQFGAELRERPKKDVPPVTGA